MRGLWVGMAAAALGVAWTPRCSQALTIVPTYLDGAGETWTSVRKGVIQEAINEWQASIPDVHTVNVTFAFTHAGTTSYAGLWGGSVSAPVGTNVYPWTSGVTHAINFNVDFFSGAYYTWWDPTPTIGGDQPFAAWDALSIARHELGHCLGFTPNFYYNNAFTTSKIDKWSSHITGSTFSSGSLSVSMAASNNLGHLLDSGATAGDVMVPILSNNVRRSIGTTDLKMLQVAYGYQIAPQFFPGDANRDAAVNGADLNIVLSNYNLTSRSWIQGDFTGDGTVNGADLNVVLSNYNQTFHLDAAVPEPATLGMAVLGAMVVLAWRPWRRRRG
jgi:hypothetical protein